MVTDELDGPLQFDFAEDAGAARAGRQAAGV